MVRVQTQRRIEDESGAIQAGVGVAEGVEFISDQPTGGREVDRKAKELQDKFKLPKPPGKRVPFDQFTSYLDLFTQEMWGHVEIYIYRRKPVIDLRIVDPNAYKYIDIVNEPLNLEYMINTHGGGDYGFMLKDRNNDSTVCEADLSIPMSQYEPIIDYRTLDMNSRTNRTYIKRLKSEGIINDEGEVVATPTSGVKGETAVLSKLVDGLMAQIKSLTEREQQQLKHAAGNDPAYSAVIRMMEEGHKQSVKLFDEQRQQQTPNQTIELINGIMGMIAKLQADRQPVVAAQNGPSWSELLKMQADNHAAMIALLKESKGTKEEKASLLSSIDELVKLKDVLESFGGGGSSRGGRREWWESVLDNLAPVAARALGTVDKYLDFSAKMAGVQQQQPNLGPQPVPPQQHQNLSPKVITLPQPTQQPLNEGTVEMPKTAATEQTEKDQVLQGAISMIQTHGALLLEHMNGSGHGAIFADNLVNMFGRPMYNRIKQVGAETLLQAMQAVPDFWNNAQIALEGTPESVTLWIQDFMGYPETLPPPEDGEED